jgi:hypothetical protein
MKRNLIWSEDSEFLSMKWEKFLDYHVGQLIMSIATNEFRRTLEIAITQGIDWHTVNYRGGKDV